jgi:single-strand DNA-binding protein
MARSLNKVFLVGNLGQDAETKFTPSGTAVSNFSLATENRWKDKQSGEWKTQTEWHRCVLWNAENLSGYLLKGKQVHVEGRLKTRSYEDREGVKRYTTEVVVENLLLLGGGGRSDHGDAQDEPAATAGTEAAPASGTFNPDDVPF